MKKIRESRGTPYYCRGKWFARVTITAGTRKAVLLPWCESKELATERVRRLQELINRLRRAGEAGWVEQVLEAGGKADEETLQQLDDVVNDILIGKVVPIPSEKNWFGIEPPARGGVYFVLSDGPPPKPIKIGYSNANINRRIKELACASPWPLRLVAVIPGAGLDIEQEYHNRFARLRIRDAAGSEWFRFEDELVAHVKVLRAAP